MATPWCRLWADMPNDPKWRTIAKASKQRIGDVIAVYVHMMVCASNATERGRTQGWNDEDIGTALDLETEQIRAIRDAMQGRVLDGELLQGWDRRQPIREDETAGARAKAWREEQKAKAQAEEEERARTHANARERKQTLDTDTDTDKEIDKKDKRQSQKQRASPSALPEWIPADSWDAFVAMRKQIKKPLSAGGIPLAIQKLDTLRAGGHDPRAVLDQSTLHSWQGLFEVRAETSQSKVSGAPQLGKAGQATARAAQEWLRGRGNA